MDKKIWIYFIVPIVFIYLLGCNGISQGSNKGYSTEINPPDWALGKAGSITFSITASEMDWNSKSGGSTTVYIGYTSSVYDGTGKSIIANIQFTSDSGSFENAPSQLEILQAEYDYKNKNIKPSSDAEALSVTYKLPPGNYYSNIPSTKVKIGMKYEIPLTTSIMLIGNIHSVERGSTQRTDKLYVFYPAMPVVPTVNSIDADITRSKVSFSFTIDDRGGCFSVSNSKLANITFKDLSLTLITSREISYKVGSNVFSCKANGRSLELNKAYEVPVTVSCTIQISGLPEDVIKNMQTSVGQRIVVKGDYSYICRGEISTNINVWNSEYGGT